MAMPGIFRIGDKRGRGAEAATPGAHAMRQPSRWLRNTALLGLLALLAALGWAWADLSKRALVGSAYAARIGCVCRYVSQRSLESCESDLAIAPLGRIESLVSLSQDPRKRTVSAGIPLLANQTATFDSRNGCQLSPWNE